MTKILSGGSQEFGQRQSDRVSVQPVAFEDERGEAAVAGVFGLQGREKSAGHRNLHHTGQDQLEKGSRNQRQCFS